MQARTLYDKLVDAHTVCRLDAAEGPGASVLLYVDRTVLNEYTSPQAFSGLRTAGRRVWRPEAALAVVDHVNPTAAQRVAAMPDPGGAAGISGSNSSTCCTPSRASSTWSPPSKASSCRA
jgi:3-isopropylmalate/(R)-2-methylmalate dehydratase large subunit